MFVCTELAGDSLLTASEYNSFWECLLEPCNALLTSVNVFLLSYLSYLDMLPCARLPPHGATPGSSDKDMKHWWKLKLSILFDEQFCSSGEFWQDSRKKNQHFPVMYNQVCTQEITCHIFLVSSELQPFLMRRRWCYKPTYHALAWGFWRLCFVF